MFNSDIADLTGNTEGVPKAAGWPEAFGGVNGVSPTMVELYNKLVREMASYEPEAFLVAGDLMNGHWFRPWVLDMFDPQGQDYGTVVDRAAEIYYGWFLHLFHSNGIDTVIAAVGDHDVGDNDWNVGGRKSKHVITMRKAFGRTMVEPLNIPDQIGSVPSRPLGTDYESTSYAYQLKNVLFVTLDVFRQDDPNKSLSVRTGSVTGDVEGEHLHWLEQVLEAADKEELIDHVIVQGHVPALPGVRKDASSGMMIDNREESPMWQALRAHSHDRGGKVRFYFGGEVHTVTSTKDPESDLVQLVHGNPPLYSGEGNYIVFTVHDSKIEAELRMFNLQGDDGKEYQYRQASKDSASSGPTGIDDSREAGKMTLDVSGEKTKFETSGWLQFVDYRGALVRFDFNGTASDQSFHNTGEFGDLNYEGWLHGEQGWGEGKVELVDGVNGNAGRFDGKSTFIKSGLLPKTDSTSRTISAWVRIPEGKGGTVLGSGMSNKVEGGVFNVQVLEGKLVLEIGPNQTASADGGSALDDEQWHHIAVALPEKRDNRLGQVEFYINGKRVKTKTNNADMLINTYPGFQSNIHVGSSNQGNAPFFTGDLDNVTFWGSPLDPEAIDSLAKHQGD